MIRARVWRIPLLVLAGIPAFMFAYLGHFGRLILDDFCVLHIARSMDPWQAIVHHYNTNTASFSRLLLHSLFVPIDELATALTSLAVVIVSIAGLYLIQRRVVATFLRFRPHNTALWIIAALATAASINAFATPESFFWYNASVGYVLPAAICILYIALLLEIAHKERSIRTMCLAAPISAAIAFALGLSSEMFVVFQFALLALAIVFSALLLASAARLRVLSLVLAGLIGTAAALVLHLVSPGTRLRIEYIESAPYEPIRMAPALLGRTLDAAAQYLAHPKVFAGFMLLFGLGLALTLVVHRPAPATPKKLEFWPLGLCLLLQLLFVPILWTHVSDLPQVVGRFSFGFAIVVAANLLSIAAIAILILWRGRISRTVAARRNGLMMYSTGALLYAVTFFAMTQVRSIHYKAALYLVFSAVLIICVLCWQLSLCLADPRAKRVARLATLFFIMPAMTTAALVAVSLFGQGLVTERMLAPVAFLQVMPGLIWGTYFAILIQRLRAQSGASKRWFSLYGAMGLVLAGSVSVGIVLGHAKLIPDFAVFARAWDARHQQLNQARENGLEDVEIQPLEYDVVEFLGGKDRWYGVEQRCVQLYYEINNIRLVPS